jgi:hypothetical protein
MIIHRWLWFVVVFIGTSLVVVFVNFSLSSSCDVVANDVDNDGNNNNDNLPIFVKYSTNSKNL